MRTADENQSPDGGAAELGDGYKVSAQDLAGGFGDDWDDDTSSGTDETSGGSGTADDGDAPVEELGLDEESVADLSETQAEDVLVELVEQEGFSTGEAQDIVDDLQDDTGLSAGELLEDYVEHEADPVDDPLGFDGGLGGGTDPLAQDEAFDALGRSSDSDLDPDHDGRISEADARGAQDAFDFDLGG